MPVYEYRCHRCDTRFEARRPLSAANEPIACPQGHPDTTRLLSVFAAVGTSSARAEGATSPGGGCGPGCACSC